MPPLAALDFISQAGGDNKYLTTATFPDQKMQQIQHKMKSQVAKESYEETKRASTLNNRTS
jgi:hypothetical protein